MSKNNLERQIDLPLSKKSAGKISNTTGDKMIKLSFALVKRNLYFIKKTRSLEITPKTFLRKD
jgi:hypothetical protein